MPIHVLALGIASVITRYDSIRINYRCDPKIVQISHLMADDFPADQKVDEAVDDKTRMRLSAMLPTNDNNYRLGGRWIILVLVGNFYYRDVEVAI